MSTFLRRVFTVLGLSWLSISAFAEPFDVLKTCADRAVPATGIEQLEKQCPGLQSALHSLGFASWLSPEVSAKLNSRSLPDFTFLSSRYEMTQPHQGPSAASLPGIAAAVNGVQPTFTVTWLDRLKSWLKRWIAEHHLSGADWLYRWWDRLVQSSGFLTAVGYAAMTLVVLAALIVIHIELRALGIWGRRRPLPPASAPAAPVDFDASPLGEASGLGELFNRLVIFLARSGRLPREHGLTHREVIAQSTLDTPEQHMALEQVAASAELLRYGPPAARQTDFALAVAHAQSLLDQLSSLPAPA